jgi:hypothetical protein
MTHCVTIHSDNEARWDVPVHISSINYLQARPAEAIGILLHCEGMQQLLQDNLRSGRPVTMGRIACQGFSIVGAQKKCKIRLLVIGSLSMISQ